jgi:hypothetical protein
MPLRITGIAAVICEENFTPAPDQDRETMEALIDALQRISPAESPIFNFVVHGDADCIDHLPMAHARIVNGRVVCLRFHNRDLIYCLLRTLGREQAEKLAIAINDRYPSARHGGHPALKGLLDKVFEGDISAIDPRLNMPEPDGLMGIA